MSKKTSIYIDFPDLNQSDLDTLMELEKKMVIKGGTLAGTGYHIPTHTRDWHIEAPEERAQTRSCPKSC